ISRASSRLRSSTRLRLLRLSATKLTLSPSVSGGIARPMSPCGGSILITSAPMSASSVPASGPAMKLARSITRIPPSACGIFLVPNGRRTVLSDFEARLVDDVLVHRDLPGDARAEHVGAFGHHGQADLDVFLLDVGPRQDGVELLDQPVDDRLRRAGRRVDALERVGLGLLDAELVERGNVRQRGPP